MKPKPTDRPKSILSNEQDTIAEIEGWNRLESRIKQERIKVQLQAFMAYGCFFTISMPIIAFITTAAILLAIRWIGAP